jgi:hypothetical protein
VPLVAVVLALGAFVLHLRLATRLATLGVLGEANVLFDADPAIYLTSFTRDEDVWRWGGRSFVHPNISNIIYPLVAGMAAAIHAAEPSTRLATQRERVALLVCPLAAAGATAVLFVTIVALDLGIGAGILFAILSQAAFSGVLFGSIPESYALSGLGLALLFLIATRSVHRGALPWPAWLTVGTVVTGITISNLVAVGLVAFAVAYRAEGRWRALRRSASLVASVLAITFATYEIGAALVRNALAFTPRRTSQLSERRLPRVHRVLVELPAAMANTFAPPRPVSLPYTEVVQPHPYILTYRAEAGPVPGQSLRTLALAAVLVFAIVGARWASPEHRVVLAAAALIIGFNWALHSSLGIEMFLYSQHWAEAALLVLSGSLAYPGRWVWTGRTVLVGVTAACVWNSVDVWRHIVQVLASS